MGLLGDFSAVTTSWLTYVCVCPHVVYARVLCVGVCDHSFSDGVGPTTLVEKSRVGEEPRV